MQPIEFKTPISVPDVMHPGAICWRRVSISIHFEGTAYRERVARLYATVRNKETGRAVHELYCCSAFKGVLDALVETIFRPVIAACQDPTNPCQALRYSPSGGFSQGEGSSPVLNFELPNYVRDALLDLSAHQTIALVTSADQVSKLQEKKRRAASQ